MSGTELHVRAGVWAGMAVLFMEGEAPDRTNGGHPAADALLRVALASGLRLTTDLEHLAPQPIPGWRLEVDEAGRVTLAWPHLHPLLDHAPLDLPPDWLRLAIGTGVVEVFVGHHLGQHEIAHNGSGGSGGSGHTGRHLAPAAESGELASGMVRVVSTP